MLENRIAPAYAAALVGTAANFAGDSTNDTLLITAIGGLLSHNRFAAGDPGFASAFDFDSSMPGVQTLAADTASTVAINLGLGTHTIILGGDHHAAALKAGFTVNNPTTNGNTLVVDDSAATAAGTVVVNATTIAGSGLQVTTAGQAFGSVTLRTGAGADAITIASASAALTNIESGAGNDTVIGSNAINLPLRIDGGAGSDKLTGGSGPDEIHGGAGNDQIVGSRGSDRLFGEEGLDTFIWNPGDGSDFQDGGSGTDVLIFNGSNATENIGLSAQGTIFHLTRDVGAVTQDAAHVEQVAISLLAGADNVVCSDLSSTAVHALRLNVGVNGAGNGAVNSLTMNGSDRDDHLRVDSTAPGVEVSGLGPVIQVSGFDATDTLLVNGGLGTDNVFGSAAAMAKLNVILIGETASNTHGPVSFAAPATYDAGKSPVSIASDNLFGTGGVVSNELVVADAKSNSILILENAGAGAFLPALEMSTGGKAPRGVVIADFNGDSRPDIAVTNSGSGNVSIFLNAGDGTFAAPVHYSTTSTPGALRAGDVTGDGLTDLVMTSAGNTVTILPGHVDGSFGTPVKLSAGGVSPKDLALADFSATGRLDIAVANGGSNSVALLVANPDFTFAKPVSTHVGVNPTALAVGDFDGDGNFDLAVTHGVSHFVSVLLNESPTTRFSSQIKLTHPGNNAPLTVAAGDLNGDGRTDLVVGNTAAGTVSIYLNLGGATFNPAMTIELDNTPPRKTAALVLSDFNGDGLLDIATANAGSADVSVLVRVGF